MKLAAALPVLLASRLAGATAIAILSDGKSLVLAGDEKITSSDPKRKVPAGCKLHRLSRALYFVAAGYTRNNLFDIETIARRAGSVDAFDAAAPSEVQAATRKLAWATSPATVASEYAPEPGSHSFLEVAFVGFEAGRLHVWIRKLALAVDGPAVSVTMTGEDWPGDRPLFRQLGTPPRAPPAGEWWRSDLVALARTLVTQAIADHPEVVGGAIDVVRFQAGAAEWLRPLSRVCAGERGE